MDILVASLHVVLHSIRPICACVILCNDRVSEAKLLFIFTLQFDIVEVEGLVTGPFPSDLLILSERSWLNFKSNDALMEGIFDFLSLYYNIPMIVEDILIVYSCFVINKLSYWDT